MHGPDANGENKRTPSAFRVHKAPESWAAPMTRIVIWGVWPPELANYVRPAGSPEFRFTLMGGVARVGGDRFRLHARART